MSRRHLLKRTWQLYIGFKNEVNEEKKRFFGKYLYCFAFSFKDLGVLKGQEVHIELTDDT